MKQAIIVYSKPGCAHCQFTKKYLDKRGIAFEERNINENEAFLEEVRALGFQTLPVITITGEEPFTGFQPDRLEKLVI